MNNRIFKMALILLSFLFFSQASFAVKGSDRFSLMFPKGSDPALLGSDRFSLMFPKGSDPVSQGLTPYTDFDSLLKKIKEYGGVLIHLEDNKSEEKIISIETPYEKRTRREKEMIKGALEALGYTVSKERQEELNNRDNDVFGGELEAHNKNDIFHEGSDNESIIDGSQIEGTAVLPDGSIVEVMKNKQNEQNNKEGSSDLENGGGTKVASKASSLLGRFKKSGSNLFEAFKRTFSNPKIVVKKKVTCLSDLKELFNGESMKIELTFNEEFDFTEDNVEEEVSEILCRMIREKRLVRLMVDSNTEELAEKIFFKLAGCLGGNEDFMNSDLFLDIIHIYLEENFPLIAAMHGTDAYKSAVESARVFLKVKSKDSNKSDLQVLKKLLKFKIDCDKLIEDCKKYVEKNKTEEEKEEKKPDEIKVFDLNAVKEILENAKRAFMEAIKYCNDREKAILADRIFRIYDSVRDHLKEKNEQSKIAKMELEDMEKQKLVLLTFLYSLILDKQVNVGNDLQDRREKIRKLLLGILNDFFCDSGSGSVTDDYNKMLQIIPMFIKFFFDVDGSWLLKSKNGYLLAIRAIFNLLGEELKKEVVKQKKLEMVRKENLPDSLKNELTKLLETEQSHMNTIDYFEDNLDKQKMVKESKIWVENFNSDLAQKQFAERISNAFEEIEFGNDFSKWIPKCFHFSKLKDLNDFINYLSQALVWLSGENKKKEDGALREAITRLKEFAELVRESISDNIKKWNYNSK